MAIGFSGVLMSEQENFLNVGFGHNISFANGSWHCERGTERI